MAAHLLVRCSPAQMSAKDLVEDAQLLWARGRKGSAFALILIAFAATARVRYPRPMPDNESFKRFIQDELATILGTKDTAVSLPFRGKSVPIEDILYSELRCQLIHEGELPDTITFTPKTVKDGVVCDVITITDPFGMPESWVLNMIRVIVNAPENARLFTRNT